MNEIIALLFFVYVVIFFRDIIRRTTRNSRNYIRYKYEDIIESDDVAYYSRNSERPYY